MMGLLPVLVAAAVGTAGDDPAAWLAARATAIARGSCVRVADPDGGGQSRCLYQPQAGVGYGGQFTRDWTYTLINSPGEAVNLSDAVWATEQIMRHQRSDGLLPDMLAADPTTKRIMPSYFGVGTLPCLYPTAVTAPDMPLPRPGCCPDSCNATGSDSAQFAALNVIALALRLEKASGKRTAAAFLTKHHAGLSQALQQVPRHPQTGLVWSDPANPRIGFGFQDTVALTGAQTYASILMYEATTSLCAAAQHFDLPSTVSFDSCAVGRGVAEALGRELWDDSVGMLRASSVLGSNVTDIWASAYAVLLVSNWSWLPLKPAGGGPPLLTMAQRASVVAYLHRNLPVLFVAGQTRNLPVGQSWPQQYCVPASVAAAAPPLAPRCTADGNGYRLNPPGRYQNGGGWAVALHHVLPALALKNGSSETACGLMRDFIANAQCHGDINEWVDEHGLPRGVGNYSASASNAYAAAAALRCRPTDSNPEALPTSRPIAEVKPSDRLCGNLSGRWNFSGYQSGHYDVWEEVPVASGQGRRTIRVTSFAPGDDAWHTATATLLPPAMGCPAVTSVSGAMVSFVYNTSAALGHVSRATGQLRDGCTAVAYASCACSGAQCSHYTRLTGPGDAPLSLTDHDRSGQDHANPSVLATPASAAAQAPQGGCRGRGSTPELDADASSIFFGNHLLLFEFDAETNGLVNVTACDPVSKSWQGFNKPSPPPAQVHARSAVPLWQLSLSDLCTPPNASLIQTGELRLDGLSAPTAKRWHAVSSMDGAHTLTLVWEGATVHSNSVPGKMLRVNVNITVTMREASASQGNLAELGALVSKRGVGGFCLQSLALPNMEWTFLRDRRDKLLVPHYFGHVGDLDTADGVCYQGSCDLELTAARAVSDIYSGELSLMPQGNERSMQFAATWTEESAPGKKVPLGLYLGAHDSQGRLQLLTATGLYPNGNRTEEPGQPGERPAGNGGLRYYHFPSDLINVAPDADWRLEYPVVVGSFVGDWYDAAMLHRSWALQNASWTARGNLSTRAATEPGYPRWLLEAPFWAECNGYNCYLNLTRGARPDIADNNIALRNLLGVEQIGFEMAKWNTEAWDWGFPNFTARNTTMAATVRMEGSGVRVVPYTNGRLFDPEIPDWTEDHASQWECVGVNGGPYFEKYEPSYNWSQHVMNPAATYWQEKVSNLSLYLNQQARYSGVYNDAVTSPPQVCASPNNGAHTFMAGSAWVDGVREMWRQLRDKAGPGKMIMSESNAEAYVGTLDANLAIYGFRSCGKVPAFQSVYADHTVMVGAIGMDILMGKASGAGSFAGTGRWAAGATTDEDRSAYRALLAEQLNFGSQLGWLDAAQALGFFNDSAAELEYTRRLVRLKTDYQRFLTVGRLLRPPRVISAMPRVNLTGSSIQVGSCELDIVLSSAWADGNGSAIWLAVNQGKVAVDVTVRLRVDDASIAVRRHSVAEAQGWRRLHPELKEVELSAHVPALSGVVVEL